MDKRIGPSENFAEYTKGNISDFGTNIKDYTELKKNFLTIKNIYRPVPFYHLDGNIADESALSAQISGFQKSGYGGLALLPVTETLPKYGTDAFDTAYGALLKKIKKAGMTAIFYDDCNFPTGWAGGALAKEYPEALARQLCKRELACTAGENTVFRLENAAGNRTMSVVAVEETTRTVIDLRSKISGDAVLWPVPDGNWTIIQYYCTTLPNTQYVNFLNYEACQKFISLTYRHFADQFGEYIGNTVFLTFYDDIQYITPNRRMWDDRFNEVFEKKYGFDPAPYYPALFSEIKENTEHYKALFMTNRAEMLADGFFKAVSDFTKSHGLVSTGHVAEPKTTSAPGLYGDSMLYQKYAGGCGLDLVHMYGYGLNGLKMASSSAYNFDKELVCCEIYGNYYALDENIMYREAMNAFVRGVNYLIPHTLWLSGNARIPHEVSHRNPLFKNMLPAFNDFAARCQTLLRGGRHICDIALLYPIYSLAAQTSLYEAPHSGFEFSQTPSNADYMNMINAIMNYCGQDVTVLHPETLNTRCRAENGILYLDNAVNFEQYKLLIMPGQSMMGLENLRLIKKFFDSGGKIIATAQLPFQAFEFQNPENGKSSSDCDDELAEIIEYIFNIKKTNLNSFAEYYENHNQNGGCAYFIPPSRTVADGTDMVDNTLFLSIIDKLLENEYDVIIGDMPRITNSGILNLALPMFYRMNTAADSDPAASKKYGGVFNHIHKKYAGCDIYYFSNTTNMPYHGTVSVRGKFTQCEEWNPHTGKIKKADLQRMDSDQYTSFSLKLDSAESVFVVCRE